MRRWLPLLGEIEAYAKREDCSRVRIFGRKGWLRVLDSYAQEHIIVDKGSGLMAPPNTLNAYDLLRRAIEQQRAQQQGDDWNSPSLVPEPTPDGDQAPQGLLGRLRALQAEQSQYQPVAATDGSAPAQALDPNFRQLSRMSTGVAAPTQIAPPVQPGAIVQAQDEAGQAQQAREAAAARLARGVRNLARAEAPPPDPVDIAKSATIGVVNGAVNTVGLPADVLTGFGYLPNDSVANLFRRLAGSPQLPADEPDHFKPWTSGELRHWIEKQYTGEFYGPKSTSGRYAETIGEMSPSILLGGLLGGLRGGQAAVTALRTLPAALATDAVAPGVAVQALEQALPDSKAGKTLQKAYPVIRHGAPAVLAAKRYLSR